MVCDMVTFYGVGLLAPRPTPKLEDHPLLTATACSVYSQLPSVSVGQDSAVGIATCYGLDGPGIESRWVARFSAPVQTGSGAHPASYAVGTRSFQGAKRPGCGVGYPPPSSAEIKERVKLYFCYPSGPSCPVLG